MGYGIASSVEWGFIIPPQKLYPLLRMLRKLAERSPDSDTDSETESGAVEASKATEKAQGPPAKKRKLREIDDEELDELLELMDATMRKADDKTAEKEEADEAEAKKAKANKGETENEEEDQGESDKMSPEDVEPYLQEIIQMRRISDKDAGGTIACYYSFRNHNEERYKVEQGGYIEDYELLSVCMGKTLSLEGLVKKFHEKMGIMLREALHLKEAGIQVEDQWILMLAPM